MTSFNPEQMNTEELRYYLDGSESPPANDNTPTYKCVCCSETLSSSRKDELVFAEAYDCEDGVSWYGTSCLSCWEREMFLANIHDADDEPEHASWNELKAIYDRKAFRRMIKPAHKN
tara:strand:- start:725 stop:1075 length:351 start_codon:yes stop_codon:yes gene_type:complete